LPCSIEPDIDLPLQPFFSVPVSFTVAHNAKAGGGHWIVLIRDRGVAEEID
jgi:hypothetical protein